MDISKITDVMYRHVFMDPELYVHTTDCTDQEWSTWPPLAFKDSEAPEDSGNLPLGHTATRQPSEAHTQVLQLRGALSTQ